MIDVDIQMILRRIVNDVRVDLTQEFDLNFERQGFFSQSWARKRSPIGNDTILIGRGELRKSIKSRVDGDSVVFYSDSPYAAIHNQGGEIRITKKMHGFFWFQYRETREGFGRKKNGELRQDKRNAKLGDVAQFWKWMALKKVGSTIRIPKREFIGTSADLENRVREIIERAIKMSMQ